MLCRAWAAPCSFSASRFPIIDSFNTFFKGQVSGYSLGSTLGTLQDVNKSGVDNENMVLIHFY